MVGQIKPIALAPPSSVGAYTKGLQPGLMMNDVLFMLCAIPVLWAISTAGLSKQER